MCKQLANWERCVEFNGHECPGLAMGYKACEPAMEKMGLAFSKDQEVVCVMVCKGSRTLDIGCGGERFSFALEVLGAEASATDFSPEMTKEAMDVGKDRGSNVCFSTDNWNSVDLKEKNWEKAI